MTLHDVLDKAYSALENATRPDGADTELFKLQMMGIIATILSAIGEISRLLSESPDDAFKRAVNKMLDAELKFMIQMLENGATPELLTIALKHRRDTIAIGPTNGGQPADRS